MGVLSAVAAAVLTLAVLAILTRVSEPEDPTATTLPLGRPTTTQAFKAQGEPLEWIHTLTIPRGGMIAMVEHDHNVFLFTVSETIYPFGPGGGLSGGGLETWFWSETVGWEFRGRGIPTDHRVFEVVATSTGWLAAGIQVSRAAPMAWNSADGETWGPVELPGPDEQDIWAMTAHAGHDGIVIVATAAEGSSDTLPRAIRDTYGDFARYPPVFAAMGPDGQILVIGPLGLTLDVVEPEELGLTLADLTPSGGAPQVSVVSWASLDGIDWRRTVITDGGFVDHLFTGPDGRPWAVSGRDYYSFNGSNWERNRARIDEAERVLRWGDAFVATRWSESVRVLTSGDAVTWEPLGVSDLLGAGTPWTIHPITTRGSTLAMAALSEDTRPPEPTPEVSVERDGHTLTSEEHITIRQGEAIRLTIPRFSHDTNNLDVDFDRGEVTFLDVEGKPMVTFGLDELAELESAWFSMPSSRHRVLILTDDGTDWTVQDLNQPLGEDGQVVDLHLTDTALFAAVTRFSAGSVGRRQPVLEIWVTPLPGR